MFSLCLYEQKQKNQQIDLSQGDLELSQYVSKKKFPLQEIDFTDKVFMFLVEPLQLKTYVCESVRQYEQERQRKELYDSFKMFTNSRLNMSEIAICLNYKDK